MWKLTQSISSRRTIEIARKLSANFPEIHYHCADIHEFGESGSYDILFFSLALHHFSADDAVRLLRRCAELSRGNVLVADLRRGWMATIGVALLTTFLFREAMTRHDARVSAARAFSFAEMEDLAKAAGWVDYEHRRFRFARQAIWLQRRPFSPIPEHENRLKRRRSECRLAKQKKSSGAGSDDGRASCRTCLADSHRTKARWFGGRSGGKHFC